MANNQTPETPEEEDYKGILGDYQESSEPEASAPAQVSAPEQAPKKDNTLKIVGAAVASAAILGCLGFLGVKLWNNQSRELPETSQAESSGEGSEETTVNPAELLPENTTAAVYSENGEISPELLDCFYHSYVNQYASAMSYYGIDTATTDLKTTKLPEEAGEDMTWFEYIMDQVKSSTSQLLVFQEAANAAGYTMTDEDKQSVEEQMASADLTTYGENATEENVRTMFEMQVLASSYFNYIMENMDISDTDLQAYYEENKKTFDTCSLMGFNVYYQQEDETTEAASSDDESASETEEETQLSQETAKEFTDKLLAVKSPEEFETIVRDILINYEGYEESELENLSSQIRSDSFTYQEGFEASEWAFGDTAKAGDTYLVENDGYYSVYYLLSEPALDNTATVDVRHILYMTSNHMEESDEEDTDSADTTEETASEAETSEEDSKAAEEAALKECWKLAENTLAEWEKGDKTEDSFAELANQYSEDPGSNTNGGLYEQVTPGQMVQTFNDWCFDSSRKAGDTGIVETNYGVHVMYFSGTGEPLWKETAKSSIQTERIDTWFDEQEALYPVACNDDIINNLG